MVPAVLLFGDLELPVPWVLLPWVLLTCAFVPCALLPFLAGVFFFTGVFVAAFVGVLEEAFVGVLEKDLVGVLAGDFFFLVDSVDFLFLEALVV